MKGLADNPGTLVSGSDTGSTGGAGADADAIGFGATCNDAADAATWEAGSRGGVEFSWATTTRFDDAVETAPIGDAAAVFTGCGREDATDGASLRFELESAPGRRDRESPGLPRWLFDEAGDTLGRPGDKWEADVELARATGVDFDSGDFSPAGPDTLGSTDGAPVEAATGDAFVGSLEL